MFKFISKFLENTGEARSWTAETDQIVLMAKKKQARILGFTSAGNGAGVGLLCDRVAERYVKFGQNTLLLDLSGDEDKVFADDEDEGLASGRKAVNGKEARREKENFKYLLPSDTDKLRFSSAESLEKTLVQDFDDTQRIIVKLPAMFQKTASITSPLQGAAVCDCLFVVCVPGYDTRPRIKEMFANLKMVNIKVDGLVMARRANTAASRFGGWLGGRGN